MNPNKENEHRQLNSNQCVPPPSSQPTADGDFRCGICNKTYSRRDLRDRHRRRCIKNIGQERQSKRKSCDACAQKKLRCSMTRPSCSRCLQSRRPCVYPASCVPVTASESVVSQETPNQATTSPLASLYIPLTLDPGNGPWALSAPPLETSSNPDDTSRSPWSPATSTNVDFLTHGHTDSSLYPTQSPWPYEAPSGSDYVSAQPEAYQMNDHLPGLIDDYFGHQSQLQYHSQHGTTASSPAAMMPPTPATFSSDTYSLNNGFTMASLSSAYTEYAWSEGFSTYDEDEILPLTSYPEAVSGNLFGQGFMSKGSNSSGSSASDVIQEMQKLISPFLHPELHAEAMQTLKEPPENTLATLSAYVTCAESYEMAHGGAGNFDHFRRGMESCITPLHTLCIYQILDLIDDTCLPNLASARQGSDPCNHGPGVVAAIPVLQSISKLVQRLCVVYGGLLQTPHEEETDWTRWKFGESLRRTIYFVHIIHTLATRTHHLHGQSFSTGGVVYSYPLFQTETLLQLPLPAPEEMWLARSEEEWMIARAQSLRPWTGNLLSGAMPPQPRTLQQWLILDEMGRGGSMSSLPSITRMILACIRANNDLPAAA
ncbi:hypothetical protein BP00DRAFT_499137 [Aspergillus indologenus CBS 114.80]|uniref:Zn(2)-C6 fungal-type domain-containing protein n=1 Tax=Aspergillus indologenus CBS 114.80 TaxID=1450541 RepID=A0A2V5HV08_9EURO|nr:hypothetical protein BP00DRAFT_499137 [Aspergillus indologenus CBS 114.80]